MMLDFNDLTATVTEALYENIRPEGEGWDDLAQEDKDAIQAGAVTAVQAAMAWFKAQGVVVLPPGALKKPGCREEAEAMMAAGMAWLRANPPKLVRPKFIMPEHQRQTL